MIRNIQKTGKRIWCEWVYELSYDIEKKRFTCECEAFTFKKPCKHIKEFKRRLNEILKEGMADDKKGVETTKDTS